MVPIVVGAVHELLDLAPQEPQPGIAVDDADSVLKLTGVDRRDDLVLGQPELLACCLVAERCALPAPLFLHGACPSVKGLHRAAKRNALGRIVADNVDAGEAVSGGFSCRSRRYAGRMSPAKPARSFDEWVAEAGKISREPTADDVSITLDGTRLDSKDKVLAFLADLEVERRDRTEEVDA